MNCSTYVGGVCGGEGSVDDRTGRILMSGFEPVFTSCEGVAERVMGQNKLCYNCSEECQCVDSGQLLSDCR